MPYKRVVAKLIKTYWRFSRGLRLDVRACLYNADGLVLLKRDDALASWQLPGGRVRERETASSALHRYLASQTGLQTISEPELFAIHAGGAPEQPDQTALFVVHAWHTMADGKKNTPHRLRQRSETGFFAPDRLPQNTEQTALMWVNAAKSASSSGQV